MGVQRLLVVSVLIAILCLALASPRERRQSSEAGLLLSRVIRAEQGVLGEPLNDMKLLIHDMDLGSGLEETLNEKESTS